MLTCSSPRVHEGAEPGVPTSERHRRPWTLARLQAHGAELVAEVVRYEDQYRLWHLRGPEGIIVALADSLS